MLTVEEAQEAILSSLGPLESETLPLLEAGGRALAEEVVSASALPPFDNSAMDGYAVRAEDVSEAKPGPGVVLRVIGDIPAGQSPSFHVGPGEAARIMTGAPIPSGADAVVMVEDTRAEGGAVRIFEAANRGQHIRPAGEDVAPGQRVLSPGAALDAAALALLAGIGRSSVATIRKPRVAILTTGDEVVDANQPLKPGQIRNSNRYGLARQAKEAGCELVSLAHAGDDPEKLRAALQEAARTADAVLSAGGVSVGDYDYMKQVLQDLGRMDFWRVAVRPGKPVAFGSVEGKPLFGLPGNPVSAMLTFELFVRPALRRMAGFSRIFHPEVTAILGADVRHHPGRREYQRARIVWEDGCLIAHPISGQGSHQLFGLVEANGLAILPLEAETLKAGTAVQAILLREG
jgi:molybdopterin molybdotransferase